MKKFILGFLCGVLVTIGGVFALGYFAGGNSNSQDIVGLTRIENGENIQGKQFKIFQVLKPNVALAHLTNKPEERYDSDEVLVLLVGEANAQFYDEQKITIPAGKSIKRVGTYSYTSKGGLARTVPAVMIK